MRAVACGRAPGAVPNARRRRRRPPPTFAFRLFLSRRYFLHQLYKMKASTGDILAVSEVRERNTATVKNCEWARARGEGGRRSTRARRGLQGRPPPAAAAPLSTTLAPPR